MRFLSTSGADSDCGRNVRLTGSRCAFLANDIARKVTSAATTGLRLAEQEQLANNETETEAYDLYSGRYLLTTDTSIDPKGSGIIGADE